MRIQMILNVLACSLLGTVATAADPVTVRVAFWNLQSDASPLPTGSDPEVLKKQLSQKKGIGIWGFCEVKDLDMLRKLEEGAEAGRETDFISIVGTSGTQNRLAVMYDSKRFKQVGGPLELKQQTEFASGLQASLVVRLQEVHTGQEFLFAVNHLKQQGEQDPARFEQAERLNAWARTQVLPIIFGGTENFSYDLYKGDCGVPHRDGGFNALTMDDVFKWVRPENMVRTKAGENHNSIHDQVFIANAPYDWSVSSQVLDQNGHWAAAATSFTDDASTSDHRPVEATFLLRRRVEGQTLQEEIAYHENRLQELRELLEAED